MDIFEEVICTSLALGRWSRMMNQGSSKTGLPAWHLSGPIQIILVWLVGTQISVSVFLSRWKWVRLSRIDSYYTSRVCLRWHTQLRGSDVGGALCRRTRARHFDQWLGVFEKLLSLLQLTLSSPACDAAAAWLVWQHSVGQVTGLCSVCALSCVTTGIHVH